jgi:hypothetical protein
LFFFPGAAFYRNQETDSIRFSVLTKSPWPCACGVAQRPHDYRGSLLDESDAGAAFPASFTALNSSAVIVVTVRFGINTGRITFARSRFLGPLD